MLDILRFFKLILFNELFFNLLIFALFSIFITYITSKMILGPNIHNEWLFTERKWEHGGKTYQNVFKVKYWKSHLPELHDFVQSIFCKKHIPQFNGDYLQKFLAESCRSEFTHWAIISSTLLFFLWYENANYIFYFSILLNIPYIIVQRYNRPRIVRMINTMGKNCARTDKLVLPNNIHL